MVKLNHIYGVAAMECLSKGFITAGLGVGDFGRVQESGALPWNRNCQEVGVVL